MRTGDVGMIECNFMYNSEYVKVGDIIVFREGRTKLMGEITRLIQDA
jgi:GTPase